MEPGWRGDGALPERRLPRGGARRGAPIRLPAGGERRLAPDARRLRARAARRAARSRRVAHRLDAGRAVRGPADGGAGAGRRLDDPPFVAGEIADRGPLERGRPGSRSTRGPAKPASSSASEPGATRRAKCPHRAQGGGGDRAGQRRRPRRRRRSRRAPLGVEEGDVRRGDPRPRAARRCRRSGSCPRGSAGSASSRRSATSSCRSRSPATSTRRTSS